MSINIQTVPFDALIALIFSSHAEEPSAFFFLKTRPLSTDSFQEFTPEANNQHADCLRVDNSCTSESVIGKAQRQEDSIIITMLTRVI